MDFGERHMESVVDAILESRGIIGYNSARYVTNIVAKMRRRFERVWDERSTGGFTDGILNLYRTITNTPQDIACELVPTPYSCCCWVAQN